MKKMIIISLISLVALAIVYFLILKPLGVFGGAAQKVKKRVVELQALPNAGVNNFNYSDEEWIRRRAINELLKEGAITFNDLTQATSGCVNSYKREIQNNPSWMETIREEVESGKFANEQQAIDSGALYQCYTGTGEFEVK